MKRRALRYQPGGWRLIVKRSRTGLGLFAAEHIPKGACIIEYTGRTISEEEAYTSRSKYLFEITKQKTIDGAARSNRARYINHSCRPNTEPVIHRGKVLIMARRIIRAGEELTYDYGREYWQEHIKPKGCRCEKCH